MSGEGDGLLADRFFLAGSQSSDSMAFFQTESHLSSSNPK